MPDEIGWRAWQDSNLRPVGREWGENLKTDFLRNPEKGGGNE
jgi:hypothetical protein